jgi:predicted dehydrogenase
MTAYERMNERLKIGVIGAGVFGGYHAGKCAAHPRLELVGIFDPDRARCRASATKQNTQAFFHPSELFASVDAAIIACPAIYHGDMALAALQAGCHVLIEKPIADNVSKAQRIVDIAASNDLIVQVGHQERFVFKAIGLDTIPETPTKIVGHRFSPFSHRGTDVSVTLDLMTHDLDLVLWLMGETPVSISGQSLRVASSKPDAAYAKLSFSHGVARLEASRVEEASSRQMRLTYPSGTIEIDFNAKSLIHDTPFDLNDRFGDSPMARDSLGAGTNAFVDAVLDGKPAPISGEDGLRALKAALRIDGDL